MEINKYKLGISLGGGGAKGFAHLGALQALNERGLYPDVISGTSAGAFAGTLYADGHQPKDIISFFKKSTFNKFAKFSMPKGGIFKNTPFQSFLKNNLKVHNFEELKTPIYVAATNIEEGRVEFFNTGPIIPAVIASCSVPVVFTPVEINNKYYVDGGLLKKFPVSVLREKCDKIIGINVSPFIKNPFKNSLTYIAEQSFHYMSNANMMQDRKMCDYLIESDVLSEYSLFDLKHVEEIFEMGYKITHQFMGKHEIKLKNDFPDFI
ncbi:patatin-like phospholipase family protein [Apibacter sp. HY039]|uniref:patatin-like phospholipase family protein n=1 Tax=Apibacter sp. HY039 TaxID=2501476 RepID=UPI000FEBBBB0|nr:patatin-like phospholipase family protein [Apibacter sp. HY039]